MPSCQVGQSGCELLKVASKCEQPSLTKDSSSKEAFQAKESSCSSNTEQAHARNPQAKQLNIRNPTSSIWTRNNSDSWSTPVESMLKACNTP